jgi:hypothetical protein
MPGTTVARIRRGVVAVKLESTYGTDPWAGAPAAADVLPVENIVIEEPRPFYHWAGHSGLLDALPGVVGELMGRVSFDLRLRGKGSAYAAGNKPEASLLLRSLGASETVDATPGSEKVTYKFPRASGHESVAAWFVQENAPGVKLLGGFADGQLLFVAGQPVVLRYTCMALHGGRNTQALVTQAPAATPIHPILASAAFQVGTENYAAAFRALTISLNNILAPRMDPNDANAYGGFFITRDPNRPPTLEFDPEAVAAATYDWFTKWGAGTLVDWSFGTNGAQYARIKFGEATNSKAQIASLRWGQRDELRTFPVILNLLANAGEDSLVIVFD